MPYEIVRNDITTMKVDAIVNAANSTLLGGGGVDGAIHRAAGPELYEECKTLGGCETGDAKLTKGYALPARYVIHTVGPVWHGGGYGEAEKLKSCYRRSLELAKAKRCRSVAFPLISAGVYGYPREAALRIAVETIRDFLNDSDMQVYIVIFDRKSLDVGEKLAENIRRYIDDNYVRAHEDDEAVMYQRAMQARCYAEDSDEDDSFSCIEVGALPKRRAPVRSLDARIRDLDESFSQMLLRKIDEAGMKDSECYKRANVDRKLFSKIRSDVRYRPSKRTAVALAIALELPRAEAEDLLKKAGYALSRSVMFDVIIEYFLDEQIYDIQTINEVLFNYDQQLLGA